MRPPELKGPLVRFQAAQANKEDTLRLLRTLNEALESHALTEAKLVGTFERWWPDLEARLLSVTSANPADQAIRPQQEMLEEILTLVRELNMESKALRASSELKARAARDQGLLEQGGVKTAEVLYALNRLLQRAPTIANKPESEEEREA